MTAVKRKVFISRALPQAGIDILVTEGLQVEINPQDRVLSPDELSFSCRGKDGLLCFLTDTVDRKFLDEATALKGIANMAVGFDNIDIKAATERGIPVSNTPGVLTDATADLTWALLLAVARRIPEAERYLRAGKFENWGPMLFLGGELRRKTLGIIGAGRIGTAVGLRARGFGMKVIYSDPVVNKTLEEAVNARKSGRESLLKESDYVTLHVPLNNKTEHLIGREELGLMKKTSYLINTSRGAVVDEAALVDALRTGALAGAGLDVFEREPLLHPGLLDLSNVVLLPHIGSATTETRTKMAEIAANNLVAMLRGRIPPDCVNPEVLKK